MNLRRSRFAFSFVLAIALAEVAPAAPAGRVLIIVGPSTHPPGTHEVAASGRLLKHCVEHMPNVPGVQAEMVYGWPADQTQRDTASTVILLGDTFPAMRLPDSKRNLAQLAEM